MKYLNGMQTVKSMRSSGYRSTDYAVAELIDNSIQAGATDVVLAVVERTMLAKKRKTSQATQIWVLDNGSGMGRDLAQSSVSFGGSDRYDDRSGMGRFGMGLPQASVSQCKRTDLWTWQNSDPRDALSVRIDLGEIEEGVDEVPPAVGPVDSGYQPLPGWVLDLYENHIQRKIVAGSESTPSGTAVRWSQLDRVQWVKGETILGHVEFLLGRIYRRFLAGTAKDPITNDPLHVAVKVVVLDEEALAEGRYDFEKLRSIRPNDPMHLATPKQDVLEYFEKGNADYAPKQGPEENRDEDGNPIPALIRVDDAAPFREHHPERKFAVQAINGTSHEVVVRTSRVSDDGRPATVGDPGRNTHQGRHFGKNRGVSLMRADREVTMDETLYYDAPDRWWSVEVSFPPALDEVFGVTNNKQDIPNFKELCASLLRKDENGDDETSFVDAGDADEGHGLVHLEAAARYVLDQIRLMRKENKAENKIRTDNADKRVGVKPSAAATVGLALQVKRHLAGIDPTESETAAAREAEGKSEEELRQAREARAAKAVNDAKSHGVSDDDAQVIAANYMKGLDYQVIDVGQDQAEAFFWPDTHGDLNVVYMNTKHPAHEHLLGVLRLEDERIVELSEEEAKRLLGRAADALGWLIHGWVRMEDNLGTQAGRVRKEWGTYLRGILESPPYRSFSEHLLDVDGEDDG